jgi:hypothetical protein
MENIMCCRSDGGGFTPYDKRVKSAILSAKKSGADLSGLLVAEDHKGLLWLTFVVGDFKHGVTVKDLHLIAKAWEDEGELYEEVYIIQIQ